MGVFVFFGGFGVEKQTQSKPILIKSALGLQ